MKVSCSVLTFAKNLIYLIFPVLVLGLEMFILFVHDHVRI